MAIGLSKAVEGFIAGREARRRGSENQLDDAVKMAQLSELGYDFNPSTRALMQRPDYVSTKSLEREKLFGELEKSALDRQKLKSEIEGFGQALPKGFVRVQGKVMRDPNFVKSGGDGLTAGQRLAKDKATKEIFESVEMNKARKSTLDKAAEGAGNIPKGFFGKVRVDLAQSQPWTKGMFGVTDRQIQDAQEMKMALTMGTLAETAYTKGAISDKEMALFQKASANNDFNSPAVVPVLEKIRRYADAQDAGLFGAYKQNYGEDPKEWFGQVNQGAGQGVPEWAAADPEAYQRGIQAGGSPEQIQQIFKKRGLI